MEHDGARRGRRVGNPDTRAQIVDAAREVLAERGVHAASLRLIADRAGVDASLLVHYFGGKSGLVEEAVDWPFDLDASRASIMSGSHAEIGRRLVRLFVEVWDDAGERHPILVLLRVAGTDRRAAGHLTKLLRTRLLGPLWPALLDRYGPEADVPDPDRRGELIASHLLGLAVTRYVLRLDAIAAMRPIDLENALGPSVQRLFEP